MKSRSRSTSKKIYYSRLSPRELDAMAAPFEKQSVATKPLTAAMRAQERRAKRKRGRPVIGEGAERVLLTLERGLLREADSYAKKHRKNRSQLVSDALRAVLRGKNARRAS